MTGDDVGGVRTGEDIKTMPRARQNVVFELGYFVGRLGRSRVAVLLDAGVEEPTDLKGVVYTPTSDWKLPLVRELEHARIPVDRTKM